MFADKAIETLIQYQRDHEPLDLNDFLEAQKLSIEALKRHEKRHTLTLNGLLQPLPGED